MSEALANFQDPEGLVLRYLEDPRADLKDMIMVQYSGLVERIARRFDGLEPHEDLVQVGFIGLLNALSKFDPKAGVRFNTYATHLIAGEIKHYLRDRTQTIRQPAWLQELRHKVNKAANALQAELSRPPTEQEIADEIGVSEAAVHEVYQTQEMLKIASLDASLSGDEEGSSEVDELDAATFSPEQLSVEDRVVLESAMQQLRDLEREVLVLFHFDMLNQTEIAHKLGISCNYVSHILRQSLAKLRRILTAEVQLDRKLRKDSGVEEAVLDEVTGIYNEEYFRARLVEEMHRMASDDGLLSILLVDFVGLNTLRSFYGEASVEDFLADAAEFLKDSVRRLDIVCRFGQYGFGVILPATGSTVSVVRQRLHQRLEQWLHKYHTTSGSVRFSMGEATFPAEAKNAQEMLKMALPSSQITLRPSSSTDDLKKSA